MFVTDSCFSKPSTYGHFALSAAVVTTVTTVALIFGLHLPTLQTAFIGGMVSSSLVTLAFILYACRCCKSKPASLDDASNFPQTRTRPSQRPDRPTGRQPASSRGDDRNPPISFVNNLYDLFHLVPPSEESSCPDNSPRADLTASRGRKNK